MNRFTINGVTIELPTDMQVNIRDGFIAITHSGAKAVLDKPLVAAVVQPTDPTPVEPTARHKSMLPANVNNVIVKYLKQNKGKAYSIGISRAIGKAMKVKKIVYPLTVVIKDHLITMVEDGTLVILNGTGRQKLYGLASMQEPIPHGPPPVYDWRTEINNHNHEENQQ
jgi:hypothetical protein